MLQKYVFPAQPKVNSFSQNPLLTKWSSSSVLIEIHETHDQSAKSRHHATGFFIEHGGKIFLATNYHVLSGRNFETKQLSKDAVIPKSLRLSFHHFVNDLPEKITLSIQIADKNDKPLWHTHPQYSDDMDIAVLPLTSDENLAVFPADLNDKIKPEEFPVRSVSNDAFIVGFPFPLDIGGFFPIWKRASIATEPEFPINHPPRHLVDSSSRQGMSGSLVLLRLPHSYVSLAAQNVVYSSGHAFSCFGIYSGRIGAAIPSKSIAPDPYDIASQLGIVWDKQYISDVLQSI